MKNLSPFQFIAIGICIALAIIGVAIFALLGSTRGSKSGPGAVVVWGTKDSNAMSTVLAALRQNDKTLNQVSYEQKNASTFESDLVNAIAAGNAPDLVLMPAEDVYAFRDKLQVIPYGTISQSTYQNTFIDESQLFLTQSGEYGLPFMVDPLVMYWNKTLFDNARIVEPPTLWSDLGNDTSLLSKADVAGNVSQSAVALGGWGNIAHARDIFAALIMQAGDPIVSSANGNLTATLGQNPTHAPEVPAESALRFYTDFANPAKTVYSWNRSLPNSQDAFVAGNLAIYFGLASEHKLLAQRNPNLNYGVASLPQAQHVPAAITYGELTGLVIPRGAKNPLGALTVAEQLVSQSGQKAASTAFGTPSVRRDLLGSVANDAAQTVFNQSALIAHSFLDPDAEKTDAIFQTMVESVLSGQNTPADAVSAAAQKFSQLIPFTPPGQTQ